jgi:hypothetical protein
VIRYDKSSLTIRFIGSHPDAAIGSQAGACETPHGRAVSESWRTPGSGSRPGNLPNGYLVAVRRFQAALSDLSVKRSTHPPDRTGWL